MAAGSCWSSLPRLGWEPGWEPCWEPPLPTPGCADRPFPLLTFQIRTKWIPMVNGGVEKGSRYRVRCDLRVHRWGILEARESPLPLRSLLRSKQLGGLRPDHSEQKNTAGFLPRRSS